MQLKNKYCRNSLGRRLQMGHIVHRPICNRIFHFTQYSRGHFTFHQIQSAVQKKTWFSVLLVSFFIKRGTRQRKFARERSKRLPLVLGNVCSVCHSGIRTLSLKKNWTQFKCLIENGKRAVQSFVHPPNAIPMQPVASITMRKFIRSYSGAKQNHRLG